MLGLEDKASVIKMIYSILSRQKLIILLAHGAPGFQPCADEDAATSEMSIEDQNEQIRFAITKDPYLTEQAPKPITLKELDNPEAIYSTMCTVEDVTEAETEFTLRIQHSKTAVAVLRKTLKDCCTL